MKRFLKKLGQVNIRDFGHLFLFVFALLPAKRLRKRRPHMWLVCEYGQEARDNGYWFFRYVRLEHKEQDIVYAITKKALDEEKVTDLGETIPYGTFKHWIYYLAAEVNISSHKGGKPNAAACYLLEIYGILKNKRVFLQHGITKDLAEMFFYPNTKMRLFICGAKPEYTYVCEKFGYPNGYVKYTGFARFDRLLEAHKVKKQVLLAPTWRRWLYHTSSNPYENTCNNLHDSDYVKTYCELLTDTKLELILEENGYELVFFPHRNMTTIFEAGIETGKHIHIASWKTNDLQELLMESACMITDYSSTAMDFAYMDKPLVYYQFDAERFRKEHFEEGYFHYDRDGFGPVVKTKEELLQYLEQMIQHPEPFAEFYKERTAAFFPLRDSHNCERIYHAVRGI